MIVECPKCGSPVSDQVCESFFYGENTNPFCEYCKCSLKEHLISMKDEQKWEERFSGLNHSEEKFTKKVKDGIGKKVDETKEFFWG